MIIFFNLCSSYLMFICLSCASYRIKDQNGDKLDHAVQGHVLEHAERGDQGSATLSFRMRKKTFIRL